jgi:hypothetical protein
MSGDRRGRGSLGEKGSETFVERELGSKKEIEILIIHVRSGSQQRQTVKFFDTNKGEFSRQNLQIELRDFPLVDPS